MRSGWAARLPPRRRRTSRRSRPAASSEFAPRLIDLVADVAMNPTLPEDELAILKQQHLQGVQQQKASPQALANRMFRQSLFGDHPYARTSETEASLKLLDRPKVAAFHAAHYKPNNAFLLVVGDVDPAATFAAVEKAFGGWGRGDVPEAVVCRATAAFGPAPLFRPAAQQRAVVDLARQRRDQAQRPALVRADACQHGLRRRVQLAHRPEHPRGEGLHLLAGLHHDRLRRRRASIDSPRTCATT